jgi:hypothetical protein
VSAIPSVPDCDAVYIVFPGNSKLLKSTLVVQHHSVTIYVGMLNAIVFDPGLEQGFSLIVVSYGNNVQWFYCTI